MQVILTQKYSFYFCLFWGYFFNLSAIVIGLNFNNLLALLFCFVSSVSHVCLASFIFGYLNILQQTFS